MRRSEDTPGAGRIAAARRRLMRPFLSTAPADRAAPAAPAVVGVGIDVAGISRFARSLELNPDLAGRLFTPQELRSPSGAPRGAASLAARFAAKEAVAKALGAPAGLRWQDTEILSGPGGRPLLCVRGTVAEAAAGLGVASWHLSLSHDADVASAVVIAAS